MTDRKAVDVIEIQRATLENLAVTLKSQARRGLFEDGEIPGVVAVIESLKAAEPIFEEIIRGLENGND